MALEINKKINDPDRQAQEDEIEALMAIYGDHFFTNINNIENREKLISFECRVPDENNKIDIKLKIVLPKKYPSKDVPIIEIIQSHGIGTISTITELLHKIYTSSTGHVYLYEWLESIKDHYIPYVYDEQIYNSSQIKDRRHLNDPDIPIQTFLPECIRHGEVFSDRKSNFQAHIAPVKNVNEVKCFKNILMEDRKIARATHNIIAYRVIGENNIIIKDNDDDGEHGAGSKLSHLLELTKAENVVVMVSRWFGGIQLGQDRFKHINNCARIVLKKYGYIRQHK